MKNIYLASPFFNKKQISNLNLVLDSLKINETVGNVFLPMKHQQDNLEFGSELWQYTVFEQDVANIDNADVVVAIVNFHEHNDEILGDPGTLWEMGYAKGTNKPVVLVDCETVVHKDKTLNLMVDMGSVVHSTIGGLTSLDFDNLEVKRFNYKVV